MMFFIVMVFVVEVVEVGGWLVGWLVGGCFDDEEMMIILRSLYVSVRPDSFDCISFEFFICVMP